MQESYRQETGPHTKRRKIQSPDVFISHAGPDKVTIARPLFKKLEAHGLNYFLDKKSMQPGDCGPDEMTKAMESAKVGVFILSPEFAARKWTMRELRCFLRRRREAIASKMQPPTLIPVFYRLSIRECRKLEPSEHQDNEGNNIFEVEKFFSEERQREASTEMVKRELQELADITGIENDEEATNLLEDEFSHATRERLVARVFLWVKKKCEEDSSDVVTEGVHGPFEEEAKRSDAIGDARHQMRTTSAEIDPRKDGFKASFQVPKNPEHVILKFGSSEDAGNGTGLMMAPEERLRRSVLRLGESQNVGAVGARRGNVVGTKGMGGIGKSCALRGLALDEEVRSRFCDGIYWLVLGKDAEKKGVVEQLARITRESGGERQAKEVREESALTSAVSRVTEWFKGRRILLLIDDVWREATVGRNAMSRLREIADVENGSRTAFTAREWGMVNGSKEIEFSTKEAAPSLEILLKSANIQGEEIEGLGDRTERILRFCGGLPLALSVVGSAIATNREIAKELSLKDVLDEYLEELEDKSSILLDESADETYVYDNLSVAFETSLCMMSREKTRGDGQLMSYAKMYESLVVIQKQGWLPLSVLCLLWRQKGKVEAGRVLRDFAKASLVERKDRVSSGEKIAVVTLHDLQVDFVRQRCGDEGEKRWHEKLVQEWQWNESENRQGAQPWVCGRRWKRDMAGDEYFRDNLCRHLKGAQLSEDLWDVLSDPRWVAEKLTRAEGIGLQEDFNILTSVAEEDGERCEAGGRLWSLQKIARQARLSVPFVLQNSREVWFQLYDGLLRFGNKSKVIEEFLCKIEKVAEKPWLKSLTPDLNASDALQDIFLVQGTVVGVSGCAAKNEVTAWGESGEHLFRRTFRDGKREENVSFEVERGADSVWSENGKYVAQVQEEEEGTRVQVWDVHTGATADRVGQELNVGRGGRRCWDLTGDGKRVALGREDGVVVLWDVERGRKITEAANMRGDIVEEVSFSPDGKRLACVGRHGSILIMSAVTREVLWENIFTEFGDCAFVRSMVNLELVVSCVSWSKNGKRVACTSHVGDVCWLSIFDGESDKLIRYGKLEPDNHELPGSGSGSTVSCLSWSEDGTRLCCAEHNIRKLLSGWEGPWELSVWDGGSGERISRFELDLGEFGNLGEMEGDLGEISVSRDGRWVAASHFGSIYVWDTETGAEVRSNRHQDSNSGQRHLGWLEDGQRIFSTDMNGKIVIWRWDNLERVQEEEEVNKESVLANVAYVAWSSDDICATVSEDGDVAMYDVKTGKKMWEDVETHASYVFCLEMSGDSKRVFTVAEDGKVATWDSKTGDKMWEGKTGAGNGGSAMWSNDGTRVVMWVNRRSVGLWDGKTGDKLWERSLTGRIRMIAWSGNDTKIACMVDGARSSVVLRSARTGETIRVACGDTDCRAVLWRARTGETMGDAPERDSDSVGLKWAADPGLLEWWSSDELADETHEIHIDWFNFVKRPGEEGEEGELGWYEARRPTAVDAWNAWNAWIEREKRMHFMRMIVKWSPDDKWIASTGAEYGRVMIWNWETGVTYRYQSRVTHPIYTTYSTLEWSGDGRRVAYGAQENLAIWDIETGAIIMRKEDELRQIAWFQDGSRMVTLSWKGTLQILIVTNQGAACEKQYHDVAYLNQSDLRQLIDTNEGKLTTDLERNLERKLRIRRKRGGVFYRAGDEEICLAIIARAGSWFCSASGRHIAIRPDFLGVGRVETVLYFYELVE